MTRFKVGDKVKVKTNLVVHENYGGIMFSKALDKLKGKTLTVTDVYSDGAYLLLDTDYCLSNEMLEPVIKNPVLRVDALITKLKKHYKDEFDKIEFSYEIKSKKTILDDTEKRYLSNVIRPFRNNVKYITKSCNYYRDAEFIFIILKDSNDMNISFPYFKKGTMYKGMEIGEWYTLKELGL